MARARDRGRRPRDLPAPWRRCGGLARRTRRGMAALLAGAAYPDAVGTDTGPDTAADVLATAQRARFASTKLATASRAVKDAALLAIAAALVARVDEVLSANKVCLLYTSDAA